MRLFPVPSTTVSDMTGYIHSEESFGTVDGPGIRYVLFMQGCPLRCKYCHNPDTWQGKGTEVTVDQVLEKYEKNKGFYSKGGITVSGGEPLLQIDFITELFAAAKARGIHTCLDTSGATFDPKQHAKMDYLMRYTDLVMLDIKHIDAAEHKQLTGADNRNILAFAEYLGEQKVPVWVRHVVVPGITDKPEYLEKLGKFLGTLTSFKALEVIPYHTMGVTKYEQMGIPYPLKDILPADKETVATAKRHILNGYQQQRMKKASKS